MAKVVLVTGCTKGGIGFALCEEFAAQGCKVYATARRLESMEGFAHDSIQRLKLDVTSDADISAAVDHIIEQEGTLDVVVNNAGAMCSGPLVDIPVDRIVSTFEANAFSGVRIVQKVFPHMAARKSGTIVNMSSIVGETPTPWSGVYSASKAAITLFSETLWMELRPFGIAVMLVAPGTVRSNIARNMLGWFALPPGSLYTPWFDSIIRRINASSDESALDTDAFARKVVAAALSPTPPRYMTLGGKAAVFAFLKWLPRTWVLGYLWKVVAGSPVPKA